MTAVMQSFGFGEQLVRTFNREDGVWFVAKDVCAALGLENPSKVLTALEQDEKGITNADTLGGKQQLLIVSESGMYALVFKSRKASAKAFRKWVTQEVLPAIRLTGRYQAPSNDDEDDIGRIVAPDLGTPFQMEAMKVGLSLIRTTERVWGVRAAQKMWAKLGFPVPRTELPDLPARGSALVTSLPPGSASAGDKLAPDVATVGDWGEHIGLKGTRRDATHVRDLYASYFQWCSKAQQPSMDPDRFRRTMVLLYDHEEHPEMIRVVMTRNPR